MDVSVLNSDEFKPAAAETKYDAECSDCGQGYFKADEWYEGLCRSCSASEANEDNAINERYL